MPPSPPAPAGESILLVNPTNLQVLQGTLKRLGNPLIVARSGEEALSLARLHRPSLVMLDIMMPGIDGFETCRRLKADPETADSAVVFLSALGETKDKVQGLSLGAVDYVAKPFQPDEVLARVQTHLTIQRLKRALDERSRQLEATNAHILEAVAEGIVGIDSRGCVVFANPAAVRLTGRAADALIGLTLADHPLFVPGADASTPVPGSLFEPTLLRGETLHSDDGLLRASGDSLLPIAFTASPIVRNGAIHGAVIAFQDIRERKKQDRELRAALGEVERLKERLAAENAYLQEEIRSDRQFGEVIGRSPSLLQVLDQVSRVAPTRSSVLIQGESGTGKEAIARALHALSPRRDRPLIKVNCGAISPSLIESELFGHEKGSFTGAFRRRAGYFELADGGTIFLDEIGDLPAEAQVKLLRVLQDQELTRVGSETPIRVDVRLIAATNRNLAEMVDRGEFRLDLFFRLNVFPLTLPPLRERREDIPLLAAKFLGDQARFLGKQLTGLTDGAIRLLQGYRWPGNIRELQNVVERAAIVAAGPIVDIRPSMLESGFGAAAPGQAQAEQDGGDLCSLAEAESRYIRRVLEHTGWAVAGRGGAAEILGLPESTLRSRMKKLRIERPRSA
ncbi:MAG: sigma 54-interacting transcriptional regulator [Gammaproteobacteria bacterium]|nr:sigma 54-interacting transcriptional regulator [Gammaproteobacteria bacterium]